KTVLGTDGILAKVALGSAGRCAALGNLVLLAVRASDCDICRHRALLALGHAQHKTQCDIDLSRPPLLRHYPSLQGVKRCATSRASINVPTDSLSNGLWHRYFGRCRTGENRARSRCFIGW